MVDSRIAVVVVTYNRKKSLSRLLQSLGEASYLHYKVDLIISVDKSDSKEVEEYANSYEWTYGNKIVDTHLHNLGLKKHILSLGKWFDTYEGLVVLEDDLIVSPGYFLYVKQCYDRYCDDDNIAGISLYGYEINYQNQKPFVPIHDGNDVYFMNCAMSWGQVWLKKQWRQFEDWYNDNTAFSLDKNLPESLFKWGEKSWLKYHTRYCITNNKYFVFPYLSYSTNFSEVGENHRSLLNGNPTIYQVETNIGRSDSLKLPSFSESSVKYDGFFENKSLYKLLHLKESELTINLTGCHSRKAYKRYCLTQETLNYRIVRSFGLLLRPIEMNVIKDVAGSDIYLYDTSVIDKNKAKKNVDEILYLYKITNFASFFRLSGSKAIINSLLLSVRYRLRRFFK